MLFENQDALDEESLARYAAALSRWLSRSGLWSASSQCRGHRGAVAPTSTLQVTTTSTPTATEPSTTAAWHSGFARGLPFRAWQDALR